MSVSDFAQDQPPHDMDTPFQIPRSTDNTGDDMDKRMDAFVRRLSRIVEVNWYVHGQRYGELAKELISGADPRYFPLNTDLSRWS